MPKAEMREINKYHVQTFENGDLLITEKKKSLVRTIVFAIVAAVCMYLAIMESGDWQIVYAIGFFLFLGIAVFDLWSYFRPQRVFVSRERDVLEYNTMRSNGTVAAKDIRYFKYWHDSVHATTTGSIIDAGPKVHVQGIQVVLQSGEDVLILPLKGEGSFTQGEEQDEGKQLMRAMQGAFRSYIEFM